MGPFPKLNSSYRIRSPNGLFGKQALQKQKKGQATFLITPIKSSLSPFIFFLYVFDGGGRFRSELVSDPADSWNLGCYSLCQSF